MQPGPRNEGVILTERVPGGTDLIVDNFSDTCLIDHEPEGLIRDNVLRNRPEWDKG